MKALPAFLLLATVLSAQEPSKDPFVKDTPKTAVASGPDSGTGDIGILVETFTLPQVAYAAWLDAPADREKLHARAVEAVQKGTAVLDGCHFVRTQRGTRCTLEGVEEFIYPTEWSKADHITGLQYPHRMEMTPMGDTIEIEPTADARDTVVMLTHSFERRRFLGYRPVKTSVQHQGAVVAALAQQKTTASQRVLPGVPALAGTSTTGAATTLIFITPRMMPVIPPAAPVDKGAGNVSLTARVISLDRLRAWELMRQHAGNDAALLQSARLLITSKNAVLEHVSTLTGQSGNRMLHESGDLHFYGTEYDSPFSGRMAKPAVDAQTPAQSAVHPHQAGVTAFECRTLGFRWEAESVGHYQNDSLIDTTLSFACAKLNGTTKDPAWSEHYPQWPLFLNQHVVTSIQQPVGSTVLVSTLNPAGETGINGRPDEARVWLLFIDLTLE